MVKSGEGNGLEELLGMLFSILQGAFQENSFGDFVHTLHIQVDVYLKSIFTSSGVESQDSALMNDTIDVSRKQINKTPQKTPLCWRELDTEPVTVRDEGLYWHGDWPFSITVCSHLTAVEQSRKAGMHCVLVLIISNGQKMKMFYFLSFIAFQNYKNRH